MWLTEKILDFFKMESTEEMSISEACVKIDRAKRLADIANETINREEFYNSIKEMEDILTELSKYEHKFNFSYPPSKNLRDLRRGRKKQIKLLEKRIAKKEKEAKANEEKELDFLQIESTKEMEHKSDEEKECNSINTLNAPNSQDSANLEEKDLIKLSDSLDEYFSEAGKLVIEKGKASVSMLQRLFHIGFNRASKILEQLEEVGVVGPEIGTKPRTVNMSMEEFKQCMDKIVIIKEEKGNSDVDNTPKLTLRNIENILKETFSIEADFSHDGEVLKKLKNTIIPSASSENQIEVINTLLKYNSPKTMRLILIDDSIINYNVYNYAPQLMGPVITDNKIIDSNVKWCYAEMKYRIEEFVNLGVKNIDSFNEKTVKDKFPRVIYIVNETNEFFKHITTSLERLFMNSNMVGIYFILFSRFSLKSLSLGRIGELLEVSTADKLKTLLSQIEHANDGQNVKRNFDDMEGHHFERLCAEILKENGFENVEVTQGSGDHGIDILAEKDDITYAIQCKCYSSDIGNAAVQQAHTGKSIYKKDIAVVLTNRYFTAQAKEEAQMLGVKLWDRDKLNSMIEKS